MIQPWFQRARFGIFLHWGIYSAGGVEASWSFFNYGTPRATPPESQWLPYERYMALAKDFAAEKYDPHVWAKFFRSIGATYAVLTAKHHDGVALWPTAVGDMSIARLSPKSPPDLVGPFCEAMRAEGLRVGLYFSHADWSHPDYAAADDPVRWGRFLAYHRAQLRELAERYRPDLLWFDAAWERTAEQWRMRELVDDLRRWLPEVVLNNRLAGLGDYATPEQVLPTAPPKAAWEFCATMNHQWGYSPDNSKLKPAHHLSRLLAETVGMNGNLLLNIGPGADGTFDAQQQFRLEELGKWIARNREGIFSTVQGIPPTHFYGPSTLSENRRTLYLFQLDLPAGGDVAVKGLRNDIKSIRRLDTGALLAHARDPGAPWHNIPGTTWIQLTGAFDLMGVVLALDLEGELDLVTT